MRKPKGGDAKNDAKRPATGTVATSNVVQGAAHPDNTPTSGDQEPIWEQLAQIGADMPAPHTEERERAGPFESHPRHARLFRITR